MRSTAAQQAAGLVLPASAEVVFAHKMYGTDDAAQMGATVPGTPSSMGDVDGYLGTDHGE